MLIPGVRGKRVLATLALCLLSLTSPLGAFAQGNTAAAEAKFQEGRKLFDDGDYEKACAALADSDRLDPAIGTLGLLAACHEKQGLIFTAWKEYTETADRARAARDSREAAARERADYVITQVPSIAIRVVSSEKGIEVMRNGRPVSDSQFGVPTQLDPGDYEVVARAPGKQEWKRQVTLKARDHLFVDVPQLAVSDTQPVVTQPQPPTTQPPDDGKTKIPGGSDPGRSRRTIALVVGGVGVAGVAMGAIAGGIAVSKNSASKEPGLCDRQNRCNKEGGELRDAALAASTASTIGFVIGAAGIGTGVVLWFTAPKPRATSTPAGTKTSAFPVQIVPLVGPHTAGALVSGAF